MNVIKLEAVSTKAQRKLDTYGDVWIINGKTENPSGSYFQSKKPQLYVVPAKLANVRDPRVDIGDNYKPPSAPKNLGAMWIQEHNDPDFEVVAA